MLTNLLTDSRLVRAGVGAALVVAYPWILIYRSQRARRSRPPSERRPGIGRKSVLTRGIPITVGGGAAAFFAGAASGDTRVRLAPTILIAFLAVVAVIVYDRRRGSGAG